MRPMCILNYAKRFGFGRILTYAYVQARCIFFTQINNKAFFNQTDNVESNPTWYTDKYNLMTLFRVVRVMRHEVILNIKNFLNIFWLFIRWVVFYTCSGWRVGPFFE